MEESSKLKLQYVTEETVHLPTWYALPETDHYNCILVRRYARNTIQDIDRSVISGL